MQYCVQAAVAQSTVLACDQSHLSGDGQFLDSGSLIIRKLVVVRKVETFQLGGTAYADRLDIYVYEVLTLAGMKRKA